MTKKIPEGFATVTPTLIVSDAAAAITLYTKAFGAKEEYRMECPESKKIMHACITIGSSKVFMCDANPDMGCGVPSNSSFYLYVEDVDATCRQAKQSGMDERAAPQDMFWGDRMGNFRDKFGVQWSIATHVRDVSPQEIDEARKKIGKKAA